MPNPTENIYIQPFIVSSDPLVGDKNAVEWALQPYGAKPQSSSSSPGLLVKSPESERSIVTNLFSNVPVIEYEKLRSDYQELGRALSEMTLIEQEEEWKIEPQVYVTASYVAAKLMLQGVPPPRLFSHGSKSVVFNWISEDSRNNLYLTVSADRLSALLSSPERIQVRIEYRLTELPNTIFLLSSSIEDDVTREQQRILFVNESATEPSLLR